MGTKLDNVISRLSKVRRTGKDSFVACCPAHDDKSPSMAIRELLNDSLLIHCFAGCSIEEILQAIGLTFDDIMPDRVKDEYRKPQRMPFNARDVLECVSSDCYFVGIYISRIANGEIPSPEDVAKTLKAAGRLIAASQLE